MTQVFQIFLPYLKFLAPLNTEANNQLFRLSFSIMINSVPLTLQDNLENVSTHPLHHRLLHQYTF